MKTGKGKGGDAFFRSVKDSPSSSQFSLLNNFNLFLGSSLQIQILPDCNSIRPNVLEKIIIPSMIILWMKFLIAIQRKWNKSCEEYFTRELLFKDRERYIFKTESKNSLSLSSRFFHKEKERENRGTRRVAAINQAWMVSASKAWSRSIAG